MPVTTPGQLLVDEVLPEDMRGRGKELHSKGLRELFQEIAERYPERYRDITQGLMTVGRDAMYTSGGYSFGLRHMLPSKSFVAFRAQLDREIQRIVADPNLSDDEKSKRIIETTERNKDAAISQVYKEALAEKNPLALQIHSGSKGKPFNLMSLIGGDLLYVDHHDKPIPLPVLHSYSEGLLPGEYWAGAYGARKGVVDLKTATRDAGSFGKQLTQAAHRLLVTAIDREEDKYDPDSPKGFPSNTDDPDNEGALLAQDIGPYKRNSILTPKILANLKQLGHEHILVRSPTIGGPADGGVYARDVGIRERGALSPIGDFVGIGAAQAIAEPLAQAQIGCLAEGTEVRMADNSVKRIENICCNDVVLGADARGQVFTVRVSHTFDNGIKACIRTTFKTDNRSFDLLATADHKILCRENENTDETIAADQLPVGRVLASHSAMLSDGALAIITDRSFAGDLHTYDIEVDHPDHLFVLANGLIVSNSKHTGGVAGAGAGVSGFKAINQLVQVPKVFPGGAAHSQLDGKVQRIEEAPGGGYKVFINDKPHYVGIGFKLKVQPGDVVEAGDILSDGLPNPAEIVTHKGIGEGRRAFVSAFKNAAKDAGFGLHRRNIELVARGLINHVVLQERLGDYLPDEVLPYSIIEHLYEPRPGHREAAPADALNAYLEKPVLHYSIGTKIRPSVINELKRYGVRRVAIHNDPPPFEADMIRGMENLSHDPDWMTRMLGSNLEKGLLKAVHRGGTSDERGTSYVASLAKGVEFGKWPPVKGYDPNELVAGRKAVRAVNMLPGPEDMLDNNSGAPGSTIAGKPEGTL